MMQSDPPAPLDCSAALQNVFGPHAMPLARTLAIQSGSRQAPTRSPSAAACWRCRTASAAAVEGVGDALGRSHEDGQEPKETEGVDPDAGQRDAVSPIRLGGSPSPSSASYMGGVKRPQPASGCQASSPKTTRSPRS